MSTHLLGAYLMPITDIWSNLIFIAQSVKELLSPFHGWRNKGSKTLSHFPKITQMGNGEAGCWPHIFLMSKPTQNLPTTPQWKQGTFLRTLNTCMIPASSGHLHHQSSLQKNAIMMCWQLTFDFKEASRSLDKSIPEGEFWKNAVVT